MNRRHKDENWEVPTSVEGAVKSWDYVPIVVLMDIRDELKRLNAALHCHNFLAIPHKLDAIKRNTTKKRRKK